MKSKSYCNRWAEAGAIEVIRQAARLAAVVLVCWALAPEGVRAADAPQWMHALVNAPLPPHDEKTDAVLLYSEEILNVQSNGKLKAIDRSAYKILRPGGRHFGKVALTYDSDSRITNIHG